MGEIMLFVKKGFSFISVSIFVASLALTGCSSLPWSDETDDEDLFFEEDFLLFLLLISEETFGNLLYIWSNIF